MGSTCIIRTERTRGLVNDTEQLAHANLLVVEIGNSHVGVATVIDREVRTNIRFEPDQIAEIVACAHESWEALSEDHIKCVAVGSVVGSTLGELRPALAARLDAPIRVVGEELHRPLSLAIEAPETVGIDRVCAAAEAFEVIQGACAVVSFGTAITVDCVNGEGVFMGGAILPGVELQAAALERGADGLPLVDICDPSAAFGATTEDAIRNGIIFGIVGAMRELTERYATELHGWPQLVATGGNAELICRNCDFVDSVVPDLCIRGIALAHRRHFEPIETT